MKKSLTILSLAFLFISILASTSILAGQQENLRQALTADDYDQAAKFLRAHTAPLVFGANVRPTWLDAERFYYRNRFAKGFEFVLVDAAKRTRKRAFDHKKLAAALSKAADTTYKPFDLPFTSFKFSDNGHSLVFNVKSQRYTYDIQSNQCTAVKTKENTDRNAIASPEAPGLPLSAIITSGCGILHPEKIPSLPQMELKTLVMPQTTQAGLKASGPYCSGPRIQKRSLPFSTTDGV